MSNFQLLSCQLSSRAKSRDLLFLSENKPSANHHTPRKLYGPRSCSSHALQLSSAILSASGALQLTLGLALSPDGQMLIAKCQMQNHGEHRGSQRTMPRTPAGFSQALIKIYTPCNLPNLFSCQISSSPACTGCPPKRVWIVPTSGCATPQSSNPMFGVKRL